MFWNTARHRYVHHVRGCVAYRKGRAMGAQRRATRPAGVALLQPKRSVSVTTSVSMGWMGNQTHREFLDLFSLLASRRGQRSLEK